MFRKMAEKSTALQKWMHLSMRAAWLLLIVMLHVTYYTVFIPVGFLFRCLSDPLRISPRAKEGGSLFVPRRRVTETRESAVLPY